MIESQCEHGIDRWKNLPQAYLINKKVKSVKFSLPLPPLSTGVVSWAYNLKELATYLFYRVPFISFNNDIYLS